MWQRPNPFYSFLPADKACRGLRVSLSYVCYMINNYISAVLHSVLPQELKLNDLYIIESYVYTEHFYFSTSFSTNMPHPSSFGKINLSYVNKLFFNLALSLLHVWLGRKLSGYLYHTGTYYIII